MLIVRQEPEGRRRRPAEEARLPRRGRRFLVEGAQAVARGARVPSAARVAVRRSTSSTPLGRAGAAGRRRGPRGQRRRDAHADLHRHAAGAGGRRAVRRRGARGARPPTGACAVLHEVRDPGNAGTVLRSADAAGAGGVVFTASSVDVYNPKTVRASAGSLFHLPVVRERRDGRGDRRRARRGVPRAGDGGATGRERPVRGPISSGPVAFVFGNEAHGLPDEVAGARRRRRAGAARRARRVAEPRGRRHRVPVRVGAPPACGEGEALETIIARRRPRHPLAAHGDEGLRLRPREALGHDDRRAARDDAAGHRARRRPHGHDRSPARRRRPGGGGAASSSSPSRSTWPSSWWRSRETQRATPITRRRVERRAPVTVLRRPGAAQDHAPGLHRVAGVVGARGRSSGRGRARGRPPDVRVVARAETTSTPRTPRRCSCPRKPGRAAGARSGCSWRAASRRRRAAARGPRSTTAARRSTSSCRSRT